MGVGVGYFEWYRPKLSRKLLSREICAKYYTVSVNECYTDFINIRMTYSMADTAECSAQYWHCVARSLKLKEERRLGVVRANPGVHQTKPNRVAHLKLWRHASHDAPLLPHTLFHELSTMNPDSILSSSDATRQFF